MQKLLRQPVWAPSFALLGIMLLYMGFSTRSRGFITFVPEQGPEEIISAIHRPGLYWLLSSGAMIVGVLCLALSAGAAYLLIRGIREEGLAPIFATNLFGKIAFAIGLAVLLAVLIVGKCSHQ